MKQYLSVVIVFVVCLLAIACAWGWRIAQSNEKTNVETLDWNIQNSTIDNVNVYKENEDLSGKGEEANNTSTKINQDMASTSDSVSNGILTLSDIKANEGKNKSYQEVKTMMLKYAKNGASLNAEIERMSGYLKIEYKIALDIDNSSMKLVEPETSVNEYINNYLEASKTYTITVNSESNNIVSVVITSN